MSSGRRDKLQQKLRHSAAISAANDDEDEASRKAVMSVVQVWLDRLQLVSVIVSVCAFLLVICVVPLTAGWFRMLDDIFCVH